MTSLNLNSHSFTLLHSVTKQSMSVQLRSVCVKASFVGGKEVKEVDKSRTTNCKCHFCPFFAYQKSPVGPCILTI